MKKLMRVFHTKRVWAVVGTLLLTACGTRPVATDLVELPSSPISAIRVVYIDSQLADKSGSMPGPAYRVLSRLGYFEVGEKIKALAPKMLSRPNLWADAITTRSESLKTETSVEARAGYAGKDPLSLLVLYFVRGTTTDYGGPYADMTFQALLRDSVTSKLYWKASYQTTVRMTPFGGTKFDDKYTEEMLHQVVLDMENAKLIPQQKAAPR